MDTIRMTLKTIVRLVDAMIDNGDCDRITIGELQKLNAAIIPPKTVGREAAAKYMGLSLNRFHELRDLKLIPMPKARKGFKEKEYYLDDLEKAKEKIKNSS